jgi:hypothetical protein
MLAVAHEQQEPSNQTNQGVTQGFTTERSRRLACQQNHFREAFPLTLNHLRPRLGSQNEADMGGNTYYTYLHSPFTAQIFTTWSLWAGTISATGHAAVIGIDVHPFLREAYTPGHPCPADLPANMQETMSSLSNMAAWPRGH